MAVLRYILVPAFPPFQSPFGHLHVFVACSLHNPFKPGLQKWRRFCRIGLCGYYPILTRCVASVLFVFCRPYVSLFWVRLKYCSLSKVSKAYHQSISYTFTLLISLFSVRDISNDVSDCIFSLHLSVFPCLVFLLVIFGHTYFVVTLVFFSPLCVHAFHLEAPKPFSCPLRRIIVHNLFSRRNLLCMSPT